MSKNNPLEGRAFIYTTPPDKYDVDGTNRPKWDADMEYWLNDKLSVLGNLSYKAVPYEHGNWTESGIINK